MHKTARLGVFALGLALFAAVAAAAPAIERVGAGDVLEISIFAGGELQQQVSSLVTADGRMDCPLLGAIVVAGRGVDDIASEVRARLARDYFQDPRVTVSVKEFGATISVSGEVKSPGVFRLHEARTALAACMLAGGFTDFASARGARVVRVRDGKTSVVRVDLAKVRSGRLTDVPLEAGDRLEVPRRML